MPVPTLRRRCQARSTRARLAAPVPSHSAGARLAAPTLCPQQQDWAGGTRAALITPVSRSQHECHSDNTWIHLTAPIPGSLLPFSRCGPPMPCSQHLWQPCSPFSRLTPPTPGSWHPSHTHSTRPTLQHPSHTHGTHARLSQPIPGLHHLCQAHSTRFQLTVPLAGSQHPYHTHSTHPTPTPTAPIPHRVPMPGSQDLCQACTSCITALVPFL